MAQHIFIANGTGRIGSEMVKLLKQIGAEFTVGYHSESSKQRLQQLNVRCTAFNLEDPQQMQRSLRGVDSLFYMLPLHEHFSTLAKNIVKAAKKAGIKHIVRSSEPLADVNSQQGEIFRLQGLADELVKENVEQWTILRPNWFMQNFLKLPLANSPVYTEKFCGAGISFVDVRDIAAVAVAALMGKKEMRHRTIDINGPDVLTARDLVAKWETHLAKKLKIQTLNHSDFAHEMSQMAHWQRTLLGDLYAATQRGAMAMEVTGLEHFIGRPAITFDQFVTDHIQYWR